MAEAAPLPLAGVRMRRAGVDDTRADGHVEDFVRGRCARQQHECGCENEVIADSTHLDFPRLATAIASTGLAPDLSEPVSSGSGWGNFTSAPDRGPNRGLGRGLRGQLLVASWNAGRRSSRFR